MVSDRTNFRGVHYPAFGAVCSDPTIFKCDGLPQNKLILLGERKSRAVGARADGVVCSEHEPVGSAPSN